MLHSLTPAIAWILPNTRANLRCRARSYMLASRVVPYKPYSMSSPLRGIRQQRLSRQDLISEARICRCRVACNAIIMSLLQAAHCAG